MIGALIFASSVFAQQPSPTPTPSHKEDEVVRISTNLIQMDVTVTDKNGKIVHDLKPEDFEIYQNGQKQDISNFSFFSNEQTNVPIAKSAEKKSQQPQTVLPPSPVKPEQVRRTIALVVDDLSLSWQSVYYVRRALTKFVNEQMQDGDLVAIVRTGGGMGALQQFTTDKRQLYAAIDRIRWNSIGTGQIGTFAPMEAQQDTSQDAAAAQAQQDAQAFEKQSESARNAIFATGTLGAIDYVVRGMQELPGRKSIVLLSDGFKMYEEDESGFRDYSRILDSLHRLVDAANRASVVIYSLDARGLVYTGLTAADNTSGRSADQIESELSDRRTQLFDTQDGLQYLATQTGGNAIMNNNDLSGGIRKILDDQSYYLIGYIPNDETFDPKTLRFNKLVVKVKRPGLKVRYRSGFFGVSEDKMDTVAAAGPTGRNKLFNALTSPFAVNQVPVRMNAIFNTGPDGSMYVRSLLHIDLHDIKFEDQPDKKKQAVIDILVVAYGDNGLIVDQSGKTYTLTFDQQDYDRYLKEGLVNIFTIPVKKPGAFQLRVAIRDTVTDKVGSANQFIQVPDLKKDRIVLSGMVLEDIGLEEWNRRNQNINTDTPNSALTDTSSRQFKHGTVLNYALTILNAKPGAAENHQLESQLHVFRDGKLIFEGKPSVVQSDSQHPKAVDIMGSLMLGTVMAPGDYVLQVTVTDKMAKAKYNSASQFVQFEILE
jgi:VWFA-related protein